MTSQTYPKKENEEADLKGYIVFNVVYNVSENMNNNDGVKT